jgi:hypothetical protein
MRSKVVTIAKKRWRDKMGSQLSFRNSTTDRRGRCRAFVVIKQVVEHIGALGSVGWPVAQLTGVNLE